MHKPIDVGTRLELLVDDFLPDTMRGVRLQLQHPERREIAFALKRPWEDSIGSFLSAIQDGGSVRSCSRATMPDRSNEALHIIALAESTDGDMGFTRPTLGLVE